MEQNSLISKSTHNYSFPLSQHTTQNNATQSKTKQTNKQKQNQKNKQKKKGGCGEVKGKIHIIRGWKYTHHWEACS